MSLLCIDPLKHQQNMQMKILLTPHIYRHYMTGSGSGTKPVIKKQIIQILPSHALTLERSLSKNITSIGGSNPFYMPNPDGYQQL